MALREAPLPLILTLGEHIPSDDGYTFDHLENGDAESARSLPAGMVADGSPLRLYGTPITPGPFEFWVQFPFDRNTGEEPTAHITGEVTEPEPETVTAAAPVFDDDALTVTIPESVGVAYSLDGQEQPAGDYSVAAGASVTVTAAPVDAGYVLEGETEWSHDFPADEPSPLDLLKPDAETETVIGALAPRVLAHTGTASSPEALTLARAALSAVLQYVNGYTRGRGFHGMVPERDLQAVIVASSARLFTNPEQVVSFTSGDYTERPAILAGWTLAELAVLRRHRRTYR